MASVTFSSSIIVDSFWSGTDGFKATAITKKSLSIQYIETTEETIVWAVDGNILYKCSMYSASASGTAQYPNGYNQTQNDTDRTDFENNYRASANQELELTDERSALRSMKLGNLTTTATNEVLVFGRTYTEQGSQAQRSVVSTSVNDSNPAGSGAKTIRITYLDSAYALATEDVNLNGTTSVNTVSSTIRFIEKLEVVKGTFADGAIKLMSTTGGGGSEVIAISAGTTSTQAAHHYVPAGKTCYVLGWGASVDHDAKLKLIGQNRVDGTNLVDRHLDLESLTGIPALTGSGLLEFERRFELAALQCPEKSYIRITVVPSSTTTTLIRARLMLWEQ